MPDYTGKYTAVEDEKSGYDINELADKWLKGVITPEEKAYYEKWYANFDDRETQFKKGASRTSSELSERIYRGLYNRIYGTEIPAKHLFYKRSWFAVAASILLCFSLGAYFLLQQKTARQYATNKTQDILPGSNKAVLHLANGRKISLSDAANGELNKQGGSSITKTANGSVIYAATNKTVLKTVYDTLVVPRAGTYHLMLTDGSKVWLNAATAIRYPENFTGEERSVELLYGEAYFEVVHHKNSPFKVITANQVIEDIGTHFNVKAYTDETNLKTTVLEGSVKVTVGNKPVILHPGEQSQTSFNASKAVVKVLSEVNTEEAVAWKNGYFRFNDTKIKNVMQELARWYNIEVGYEGQTLDEGYNGRVSRYKNISQVLRMLEKTKAVHFKVEGRRVTVVQ